MAKITLDNIITQMEDAILCTHDDQRYVEKMKYVQELLDEYEKQG